MRNAPWMWFNTQVSARTTITYLPSHTYIQERSILLACLRKSTAYKLIADCNASIYTSTGNATTRRARPFKQNNCYSKRFGMSAEPPGHSYPHACHMYATRARTRSRTSVGSCRPETMVTDLKAEEQMPTNMSSSIAVSWCGIAFPMPGALIEKY